MKKGTKRASGIQFDVPNLNIMEEGVGKCKKMEKKTA